MIKKENIKIELLEYTYDCADGCCTNYGTITKINGVELECHNQDTETILSQILKHLKILFYALLTIRCLINIKMFIKSLKKQKTL